jgi:hypothetical protein
VFSSFGSFSLLFRVFGFLSHGLSLGCGKLRKSIYR